MFDIQQLNESEYYKILLVGKYKVSPGTGPNTTKPFEIRGVLQEDFSMSTGVSYTSIYESTGQTGDISRRISSTLSALNQLTLDSQVVTQFTNYLATKRISYINSTIQYWVGSEIGEFNANFTIIAIEPDDDVREKVAILQKATLPYMESAVILSSAYTPKAFTKLETSNDQYPLGTASLSIGKWLVLHGLLITSVQASFSKVVTKKGLPLYANVSVGLKSYRQAVSQDVDNYYPGLQI